MSVAPVTRLQPTSLSDLSDAVALRTGSWVVVERFGAVVTHGAGGDPCPPALAEALLTKSTAPLRAAVTWSRGGHPLQGVVEGIPVTAHDLGEGGTAWFVGDGVEQESVPLLAAALGNDGHPLTDPVVDALLHPRGPSRGARAPEAVLVVLSSSEPLPALARAAAAAAAGTEARVHTEPDIVIVALPVTSDASHLAGLIRERCPNAVAGVTEVAGDAVDWVAGARVARGAARAASRLGLPVGRSSAPAVATEVLIDEATEAVAALAHELGRTPLTRLEDHDARTSGELVRTLSGWCAAGFDVAAAAAALHVHSNTLRYRLRRAEQISGLDLSNPRQVLALQLLLT